MRIEQLEALVKVADDASMHKAADALHTSTQNVSKQIKQLEIELGASLLTRSNSGTFLTEDGEYLYHKALDILDVVEEINVNFRGNPQDRLGSSYSIERCDVLTAYSSQNVALSLINALDNSLSVTQSSVISNDAAVINNDLEMNPEELFSSYDFVLTHFVREEYGLLKPLFEKNTAYKLDNLGLAVHISRDNPLAQKKMISIREVANQSLVFSKNDASSHVETALANCGIRLRPRYRFNARVSADYYIAKNMGYGLRPCSASKETGQVPPNTVLIPLKEKIDFSRVIVFSPNIAGSFAEKAAVSHLKMDFPHLTRLP